MNDPWEDPAAKRWVLDVLEEMEPGLSSRIAPEPREGAADTAFTEAFERVLARRGLRGLEQA